MVEEEEEQEEEESVPQIQEDIQLSLVKMDNNNNNKDGIFSSDFMASDGNGTPPTIFESSDSEIVEAEGRAAHMEDELKKLRTELELSKTDSEIIFHQQIYDETGNADTTNDSYYDDSGKGGNNNNNNNNNLDDEISSLEGDFHAIRRDLGILEDDDSEADGTAGTSVADLEDFESVLDYAEDHHNEMIIPETMFSSPLPISGEATHVSAVTAVVAVEMEEDPKKKLLQTTNEDGSLLVSIPHEKLSNMGFSLDHVQGVGLTRRSEMSMSSSWPSVFFSSTSV